jgi:hypothetical protein
MCHRLRILGSLLACGLVIPAAAAAAAPAGGIGVRLLRLAGAPAGNPLARSYIVARAAPGDVITRRVEVTNTTGAAHLVSVYAAAASTPGGVFRFGPGHAQNDVSSWTRIGTPLLRLDAGAAADELVTIRVPANAVRGAHDAVVWAETSSPAPTGGGVTLVNRVGIRVYLTVDKSGAAAPAFRISALRATRQTDGSQLVTAHVTNDGSGPLSVSGRLTLGQDGSSGLRAGPFSLAAGAPIMPGHSQLVSARVPAAVPPGRWQVRMLVTSGTVTHTATATLTFAGQTASPAAPGGRSLIGAAVLLAALLLMAAAARRKRL